MSAPVAQRSVRAVVQDGYGPPDVLRVRRRPAPLPGAGEVVVRVAAVGLKPADVLVASGRPAVLRLVLGLRRPRQAVRGSDVAGTVETVGDGVTSLRVGQEVFGWADGALCEAVAVPADHLVPVPAGATPVEAAAVPMAGFAALHCLRDGANLGPGQRVLVIGASGGVGTSAVQVARSLGAEVTGVCSARNLDLVRSLGAARAIDRGSEPFDSWGSGYDVVLDNAGTQPLRALRTLLTRRGVLVVNNGTRGGPVLGPLRRMLGATLLSLVVPQTLRAVASSGRREDLELLAAMLGDGRLTPVVERAYPLEDVAAAFRHVATGHTRGKVVATV